MTWKFDISKAYDQVEWSFLEANMRKMNFNHRWIDRVMQCMRSVSYSIY